MVMPLYAILIMYAIPCGFTKLTSLYIYMIYMYIYLYDKYVCDDFYYVNKIYVCPSV